MVADGWGEELQEVPGTLLEVSGVAPGCAPVRVVHVYSRREAARALDMVRTERALGWPVTACGLMHGLVLLLRDDAQVVVLHGRAAGIIGRLLLRGGRTTVLVPRPGTWGSAAFAERAAARWANAVLLSRPDEATAGVRKGLWVPPFVVDESAELRAAVLARAQAFGWPSSSAPTGDREGCK